MSLKYIKITHHYGYMKTRNWSLYDQAQQQEKLMAMRIINDAVEALPIPDTYAGTGRPAMDTKDMIKCCAMKVYNCFSLRRANADIEFMKALGYIATVPSYKTIDNCFNNPAITPWLHQLYKILALPFIPFEKYFSIDSTGFGGYSTVWHPSKLLKERPSFNKLHIISGYRTGIIPIARVTEPGVHDMLTFAPMLRQTARVFDVQEIYADKGYLSRYNVRAAHDVGAEPYIMPKRNTLPSKTPWGAASGWNRMVLFWQQHESAFRRHYHRRNAVESSFSSIKRKFLPFIRSRNVVAQENEILYKICCQNVSILIGGLFTLGLDVDFGSSFVGG